MGFPTRRTFEETHEGMVKEMSRAIVHYVKSLSLEAEQKRADSTHVSGTGHVNENNNESVPKITMSAEGYPILSGLPCAGTLTKRQLEGVLRTYLSQNYCEHNSMTINASCLTCAKDLASGRKTRQVPYLAIANNNSAFLSAEYRPDGLKLNDPRNMHKADVERLLQLIFDRQQTEEPAAAYQFQHIVVDGCRAPARYSEKITQKTNATIQPLPADLLRIDDDLLPDEPLTLNDPVPALQSQELPSEQNRSDPIAWPQTDIWPDEPTFDFVNPATGPAAESLESSYDHLWPAISPAPLETHSNLNDPGPALRNSDCQNPTDPNARSATIALSEPNVLPDTHAYYVWPATNEMVSPNTVIMDAREREMGRYRGAEEYVEISSEEHNAMKQAGIHGGEHVGWAAGGFSRFRVEASAWQMYKSLAIEGQHRSDPSINPNINPVLYSSMCFAICRRVDLKQ